MGDFLSQNAENLGLSLLILVVVFALRFMVLRTVLPRVDAVGIFKAKRISLYISVAVLLLGLGWVWTQQLANAGSFIGLLSAGIAIALTDVLKNLAGWGFSVFRRPFKRGDRIEVGAHRGDVIDIRMFRFSMLEIGNWVDADQSTGRILHIPNGILFQEPMANYTEGFPFIWNEIPVTVTFESDWEEAKVIVQEAIDRHAPDPKESGALEYLEKAASSYLISYQYLTPTIYVKAIDFGVTITGRLLVPSRGRRAITSAIWQDLLRAIQEAPNVELAYPTTRFFRADLEGAATPGVPAASSASGGEGKAGRG